MAADLAFLTCLHGPQHDAVPCAKARYRSRTEEARGSNPLTSTPQQPWSPAWRIALAGPLPFQGRWPGSKRAATTNETASVLDRGPRRRSEAGTGFPTFRLRVGPYPSAWTRPGPSWLLRCAGDSIQCRPVGSGISAWVAREVATLLRCPSELALTRHVCPSDRDRKLAVQQHSGR